MKVEIFIDGSELDLNDFVERVTFGINKGLIESLHDVPEWSKIEIKIQK
jgi:hypothetical protein